MCIRDRYQRRVHGDQIMVDMLGKETCNSSPILYCDYCCKYEYPWVYCGTFNQCYYWTWIIIVISISAIIGIVTFIIRRRRAAAAASAAAYTAPPPTYAPAPGPYYAPPPPQPYVVRQQLLSFTFRFHIDLSLIHI
eukprot:TRINITY_DN3235_c0_g1_i25.p1 TRINITY_DN3235_c0_g1~~TRINITY_DN3235_c0_g1_i25.p1  ORF type:complete len:136 (+),score=17.92 TRINITY_DN3235_c0_g1_i25:65-472(+)